MPAIDKYCPTGTILEIMDRFAQACAESASVEKAAKLEGRSMLMFLVPKAAK